MIHKTSIVLLAITTMFAGCAGAFSPGLCDTHCEPRPSYSNNNDADPTVPIVLGSVAVIAVVALVMRADGEEPVRSAGTPDQLQIDRMFVQGRALARGGRCDGVHAIGNNLMKLSYRQGANYRSDPQIAPCY